MGPQEIKALVAPACREFGVRRLDVFGSVARHADGRGSDIDLLVEFADPESCSARRFFALLHTLEEALGREIDLITVGSIRNPFFRRRVLSERVLLYEG